jgi:hypothetical protein
MSSQTMLKILFAGIFLLLLGYNLWATFQQPVWQWGGLTTGPDRYWTIATFLDAYCGFITFYVWVFYKESSAAKRIAWFLAIMLLGNIAMSGYVLWQLKAMRRDQKVSGILVREH